MALILPSEAVAVQQTRNPLRRIPADQSGSVVVEAAFALPIVILLLVGVISYGMWFATANTLQQVANEAARSVLGSLSVEERQMLVDQSIDNSLLHSGLVKADDVEVSTAVDGRFFTVTLFYDNSQNALFKQTLVPMPAAGVTRRATIELSGF